MKMLFEINGGGNMNNKFNMSREESMFWVKRNIIDYIWKSAKLEGISVTYPDTEMVFEGLSTKGLKVMDIIALNNIKHAWYFITEHLDIIPDYPFICHINGIIGGNQIINNAGYIRKIEVKMGGTTWKPNVPNENVVKESIEEIIKGFINPTERAIELMLYCMRAQIFNDGNKRTSMFVANQIMVSNGVGVISIPIEHQDEFRKMLIRYYECGDNSGIKYFIYDYCIDGANF